MRHRWMASATLVLAAGLALELTGCISSPLAPDPAPSGGPPAASEAPPVLAVAPDGSGEYVPCETRPEASWPADSTASKSASCSVKIDGGRGGMVNVGRFTLKLSPGSFTGTAVVTMTMPDTTMLVCDLGISPVTANRFSHPAQLTTNLSGFGVSESDVSIYWYDPSRARWVGVAAQSKAGASVTAYLAHFSKYAAGKAGW